MTIPNSNFYLDFKVPAAVLKSDNAPVPTPRDVIADRVDQTTEDIRQIVAFKMWSTFANKGLIEGDSFVEKEDSFRALLDDEVYKGYIKVVRKHTINSTLRSMRSEGTSVEKQIYESALNAANLVTDGKQKPLDTEYAARLVSLDLLLNDEEVAPDPNWDEPFEMVEGREAAIEQLNALLADPKTAKAVEKMREMQHKKDLGLPTNSDADKSELKRLRQQSGLALKVAYLN